MANKDATRMKVLKMFKENEYSRNTLIKEKGTIKVRTKLHNNYMQKMRSCNLIVIIVPTASLKDEIK